MISLVKKRRRLLRRGGELIYKLGLVLNQPLRLTTLPSPAKFTRNQCLVVILEDKPKSDYI